jgi:hypothetical protein
MIVVFRKVAIAARRVSSLELFVTAVTCCFAQRSVLFCMCSTLVVSSRSAQIVSTATPPFVLPNVIVSVGLSCLEI